MAVIHRVVTTALAFTWLLVTGSVTIHGDSLGSDVNRQLAAARAATVQYHDPDTALADGYVDLGVNPMEGLIEFVNFDLVFDCVLDATRPDALSYVQSGNNLRLVGVEYSIPMECASTPPEHFLPGIGEWEQEPGVPVWTKFVPLWSGDTASR